MLDDANYKERSHQAHHVSKAVLNISRALDENKPFTEEFETLSQIGQNEPVIAAVVSSIPASMCREGACTREQLKESLHELSSEASRAALMPEDGGLLWYGFTWVINKAKIKEKGQVGGIGGCWCDDTGEQVEGNTVDAILTRAEDHLDKGDLQAAICEVDALNGMAAQVLACLFIPSGSAGYEGMASTSFSKTPTRTSLGAGTCPYQLYRQYIPVNWCCAADGKSICDILRVNDMAT